MIFSCVATDYYLQRPRYHVLGEHDQSKSGVCASQKRLVTICDGSCSVRTGPSLALSKTWVTVSH